jgi:hypothetical protein
VLRHRADLVGGPVHYATPGFTSITTGEPRLFLYYVSVTRPADDGEAGRAER